MGETRVSGNGIMVQGNVAAIWRTFSLANSCIHTRNGYINNWIAYKLGSGWGAGAEAVGIVPFANGLYLKNHSWR